MSDQMSYVDVIEYAFMLVVVSLVKLITSNL